MDLTGDNTLAESIGHGATLPVGEAGRSSGPELRAGQKVGERYALVRKVGAGAMGEVWEAQHTLIDKPMAIKFFSGSQTDVDGLQRFWREAKATAALHHPGIINVLDFGTTDAGVPFIVMELLRGRPLSAALADEGPLPWPRVQVLLLELTSALAHAHRRHIIHRDLKPSNIFLAREVDDLDVGPRERGKIIDFGIAKLVRTDNGGNSTLKTATGMVLGTLAYMSPEQLGDKQIDARSDIYSLGCVTYELLTGHRPFESTTPTSLVLQHLFERPIPPHERFPGAEIPADIEAVVLRCLCKDVSNRFQSMEEMHAAVQDLGSGAPPVQVPVEDNTAARVAADSLVHDGAPALATRRWLPLVLVLSFAAVAGLAWWVLRTKEHVQGDRPPRALAAVEDEAEAPVPQPVPESPAQPPEVPPTAAAPVVVTPSEPEPVRPVRRRLPEVPAPAGAPPEPPVTEVPQAEPAPVPAPVPAPAPAPAAPADDEWERKRRLKSPFSKDDP